MDRWGDRVDTMYDCVGMLKGILEKFKDNSKEPTRTLCIVDFNTCRKDETRAEIGSLTYNLLFGKVPSSIFIVILKSKCVVPFCSNCNTAFPSKLKQKNRVVLNRPPSIPEYMSAVEFYSYILHRVDTVLLSGVFQKFILFSKDKKHEKLGISFRSRSKDFSFFNLRLEHDMELKYIQRQLPTLTALLTSQKTNIPTDPTPPPPPPSESTHPPSDDDIIPTGDLFGDPPEEEEDECLDFFFDVNLFAEQVKATKQKKELERKQKEEVDARIAKEKEEYEKRLQEDENLRRQIEDQRRLEEERRKEQEELQTQPELVSVYNATYQWLLKSKEKNLPKTLNKLKNSITSLCRYVSPVDPDTVAWQLYCQGDISTCEVCGALVYPRRYVKFNPDEVNLATTPNSLGLAQTKLWITEWVKLPASLKELKSKITAIKYKKKVDSELVIERLISKRIISLKKIEPDGNADGGSGSWIKELTEENKEVNYEFLNYNKLTEKVLQLDINKNQTDKEEEEEDEERLKSELTEMNTTECLKNKTILQIFEENEEKKEDEEKKEEEKKEEERENQLMPSIEKESNKEENEFNEMPSTEKESIKQETVNEFEGVQLKEEEEEESECNKTEKKETDMNMLDNMTATDDSAAADSAVLNEKPKLVFPKVQFKLSHSEIKHTRSIFVNDLRLKELERKREKKLAVCSMHESRRFKSDVMEPPLCLFQDEDLSLYLKKALRRERKMKQRRKHAQQEDNKELTQKPFDPLTANLDKVDKANEKEEPKVNLLDFDFRNNFFEVFVGF